MTTAPSTEMLPYQGAREIGRAWDGGDIVVTADRYQRFVVAGGNWFRVRVRGRHTAG